LGVILDAQRTALMPVPIMVLTTVIEDASRRRYELETGMAMDIQDYVQKPANPADLLQRVEKLLKIHV
jgi:CheY-like chemotaxis protein